MAADVVFLCCHSIKVAPVLVFLLFAIWLWPLQRLECSSDQVELKVKFKLFVNISSLQKLTNSTNAIV